MLFIYVFVTLCLLGWITYPVLISRGVRTGDPLLQERIDAAEAALKQLYSQRENISKSDFPNMERQLMLSLAKLLKNAGVEPKAAPDQQAQEEAPEAVASTEDAIPYCGNCGTQNQEAFAFCPACGHRLVAA